AGCIPRSDGRSMSKKIHTEEDGRHLESEGSNSLARTRSEVFTEEFLANGWDATKAARAAGYAHPAKEGHRRASRPEMQALIQERIEAAAVLSDEVVGSLVVIMREHTGSEDSPMVRNAIAAATQLCKILGMHQRARPNEHDQRTRDMFERV